MKIRAFCQGDELRLRQVFHSAVHIVAAKDYSPEQLNAWAPSNFNAQKWIQKMRALQPFVAEEAGTIIGYADLQPDGYIDHFYVSGTSARQCVGRLLMKQIHARAAELGIPKLYSNVSHTARPFFEHFGFQSIEAQTVMIEGISLGNTRMEKNLAIIVHQAFET